MSAGSGEQLGNEERDRRIVLGDEGAAVSM
jgi:hypothetical protein